MTNTDSFDDYSKKMNNVKLSPLNRPKNPQRLEKEESLLDVLKEGQLLIDLELKVKTKTQVKSKKSNKTPESKPVSDSKNPYVRAHAQVLDQWRKNPKISYKAKEIEDMEAGLKSKNRMYDEFVAEVRTLGDSFPD